MKLSHEIAHRVVRVNSSSDNVIIAIKFNLLQSNFNDLNTDGSFIMACSNSFLSPYRIFPIAQENKYGREFSYFIMKLYVVCTH